MPTPAQKAHGGTLIAPYGVTIETLTVRRAAPHYVDAQFISALLCSRRAVYKRPTM